MKLKESKFLKLFETVYSRYNQGSGFLAGDAVTFKKNYKSDPWFKSQCETVQQEIIRMAEGVGKQFNVKVSAIKSEKPRAAGGLFIQDYASDMADIVEEHAPGAWRNIKTVPLSILENLHSNTNLQEPAEDATRENNVNIKPEEIADNKDEVSSKQTKGNEQKLATKDTKNPKAKKWDDDKPLGGGGNGVSTVKETKESLGEVYANILKEENA